MIDGNDKCQRLASRFAALVIIAAYAVLVSVAYIAGIVCFVH